MPGASGQGADVLATGPGTRCYLAVALDLPLPGLFDYWHDQPVPHGVRVLVEFGRRKMIGMVCEALDAPRVDAARVRPIHEVLADLPPMPADWLRLTEFATRSYHRPIAEVLLPALPSTLGTPAAYLGSRAAGGPATGR